MKHLVRWGAGLLLVAAIGCAAGPKVSTDLSARPDSHGWRLLQSRCQGCHKMPNPEAHTRARWEKSLAGMQRRVKLSPADWDSLLALVPPDTLSGQKRSGR